MRVSCGKYDYHFPRNFSPTLVFSNFLRGLDPIHDRHVIVQYNHFIGAVPNSTGITVFIISNDFLKGLITVACLVYF